MSDTGKPAETELRAQLRADVIDALGFREGKRETSLRRVMQVTATALRVPKVEFYVLHREQAMVVASFGREINGIEPKERLATKVVLDEQPVLLDARHNSDALDETPAIRMFAGIPVRSPTQRIVIGALCVFQGESRSLSVLEQRLLGECAGLIEDELRLRQLSVRDELTGLLNRREFDLQVQADWRRAYRSAGCLSVAILDIDFFKQVNDRFGHARGDQVLQELAELVSHYLRRDMDAVGRYGGEEFALSMPGLNQAGALQRLQGLCQLVVRKQLPNPDSPLGVLSVSIGLATLESGAAFEQVPVGRLLLHADEALYQAKARGRNQVCVRAI